MGAVIAGMHPQGFDVEVKRLGQTWRAVTKAAWQAIRDPRMKA